ncbi:S26 family signal peptidase, partial [Candidatus Parcubacteria bacterium]
LKGLNPATAEKLGKSVESFERSFVVSDGHLFVLGTQSRSFDGRYWGELPANQVEGKAYAIW